MPHSFDVCVRGAGVVGQTLALLLGQQGLRVALVAAPGSLVCDVDVRAYALNAVSRRLLQTLRIWPADSAVTAVTQMQVWDGSVAKLEFSDDAALAWVVDVPALERALQSALTYQTGVSLVTEPVQAALSVVCEGRYSRGLTQLGVPVTTKPYQQHALAARLISDAPHSGVAHQWFAQGEVLALLPVGGSNAAAWALIWSVSPERAQTLRCLSDIDFSAALSQVCSAQVGPLKVASSRSSWPLTWSTAQRWVGPGWALAGDAAHTVHPLAGQGLNLGLADAACLAQIVDQRESWRSLGDERLLRRYERARKADVTVTAGVCDVLHATFAHTDARWQALRHWGMRGFNCSGPLKAWVVRRAQGVV